MYALSRILVTLFAVRNNNNNNKNNNEYDPILDWKPPSQEEILPLRRRFIYPMKSLTSAIFFSTDQSGKRHKTLKCLGCNDTKSKDESLDENDDNLNNKPTLFVSNHQLVGIDSWLVVNELWESKIFVRAMIHPFLTNNNNNNNDEGFSLPGGSIYETFGCLPVSPKTYYQLMKGKQPSLLFPGGARESFHQSGEEYTLTAWSDESDFVRTAAKFNATIVPFSSVGAAESAYFLDQFPLAQSFHNAMLQLTPKERVPYNARYDAGGAHISFPLVFPKPLPSRHYYLFDRPIDLSTVNHNDKTECQKIYQDIKVRIKQGCKDLLQAKQRDPYSDPLKRIPYEQLMQKQAPTFPIDLLNARVYQS